MVQRRWRIVLQAIRMQKRIQRNKELEAARRRAREAPSAANVEKEGCVGLDMGPI